MYANKPPGRKAVLEITQKVGQNYAFHQYSSIMRKGDFKVGAMYRSWMLRQLWKCEGSKCLKGCVT